VSTSGVIMPILKYKAIKCIAELPSGRSTGGKWLFEITYELSLYKLDLCDK